MKWEFPTQTIACRVFFQQFATVGCIYFAFNICSMIISEGMKQNNIVPKN